MVTCSTTRIEATEASQILPMENHWLRVAQVLGQELSWTSFPLSIGSPSLIIVASQLLMRSQTPTGPLCLCNSMSDYTTCVRGLLVQSIVMRIYCPDGLECHGMRYASSRLVFYYSISKDTGCLGHLGSLFTAIAGSTCSQL